MLPDETTDQLLEVIRAALVRSSVAVRALYEGHGYEVRTKADRTPLTTADLAADSILQNALRAGLEEAAWLSEETPDTDIPSRTAARYCWICDPIDGTREFVDRTDGFSISVGLSVDGDAVIGGVALPAANELFLGVRGHGVRRVAWSAPDPGGFPLPGPEASGVDWANFASGPESQEYFAGFRFTEERMHLSRQTELERARIVVSRSEWERGVFQKVREELDWQPTGSIARKLALVATGRADLAVSLYPKSEWDICGGTALIRAHHDGHALAFEAPGRLEARHDLPLPSAQDANGSAGNPPVLAAFNQAETKSVGLVAGPSELVRAFLSYRSRRELPLHRSWG